MQEFLNNFSAKNLVKDYTCFKSLDNPSCIDLFITNKPLSFQKTTTVSTGLSDFHKMIVTVLKTTFPKIKPKIVSYRDYSRFVEKYFHNDLESKIRDKKITDYNSFNKYFLEALNKHAPSKKKCIRANHKPYLTKELRKAIMHRSYLGNKFYKCQTIENYRLYKTQKNYVNRLSKREKKNYFNNININNFTDNKNFWNITRPLFSDKEYKSDNITLVCGEKIISEDSEVAQAFNDYFKKPIIVNENRFLLSDTTEDLSPVDEAVAKFKNHPSIITINENVEIGLKFTFSQISIDEIKKEIKDLNSAKMGTLNDIPTKHLKETINIISEPLMNIWNKEIIENKIFPTKLKLADITPIFKKLDNISVENYRPVSVLPTVSKIFERIMQKQLTTFIEPHLSTFLCGYRKGFNCQYALLHMLENWKMSLDKNGYAGGILMDLSKAFDTINYQLLIAKLHAYGFDKDALQLILDYLTNRWQRTKIHSSFSTWSELLSGVPQGSILGPLLFNIYLNDLLYLYVTTSVCNSADDTTPYFCDINLANLLKTLEKDITSTIMWFEANYMKLNNEKCHFLFAGNTPERIWTKVGEEIIWESNHEKLLGLIIDKDLKFEKHLTNLCKQASAKITMLARMATIISYEKKRVIMKAFIESQFSYCPLLWMFCSRKLNRKINFIHERALRLVYNDYTSSFENLLKKDNSVSIHHRNIQRVAIEMYKVKNNLCPEIMKSLFVPQAHSINTRSKSSFLRPRINSVYYGENSIRNFGPIVWDKMIPKCIKESSTLDIFKSQIKKWVPQNCPCRLCKTFIPELGFVKSNQ